MFFSQFLSNNNKKKEQKKNIDPDFKEISKRCNFSVQELKQLFIRFKQISDPTTEVVEKIQFLQQPEFALCPFISLSFDMELRNQLLDNKLNEDSQNNNNNPHLENNNAKTTPSNNDNNNNSNSDIIDHSHHDGDNLKLNGLKFESFVNLLSVYSPKESNEAKLSCMISTFFNTLFFHLSYFFYRLF